MKAQGYDVSNKLIAQKAMELKIGTSYVRFKASRTWISAFKLRNKIDLMDCEEMANIDEDPKQMLQNLTKKEDLENVYKIDVTVLLWKALPTKALVAEGERSISGLKLNKDRIMLGLCANASGTQKIKPLVISNYEDLNVNGINDSKPLCEQSHGKTLFLDWYKNEFKLKAKEYQLKRGITGNIYLLLNDCNGNKIIDPEDENFQIICPSTYSSSIQPMDKAVVERIKTCYRHKLMKEFLKHSGREDEFYQRYTINNCITMISESWEDVLRIRRNVDNESSKLVEVRDESTEEEDEKDEENILNEMHGMMKTILERDVTMEEVISFLTECRIEEMYVDNKNVGGSTDKIHEDIEEDGVEISENDNSNTVKVREKRDEIHENNGRTRENDNENRNDEMGTTEKDANLAAASINFNPEEREEIRRTFERLERYYPRLPSAIVYCLRACKSACLDNIKINYRSTMY